MARRPFHWLGPAIRLVDRFIRSAPLVCVLLGVFLAGIGLTFFWLEASGDQVLPERSLQISSSSAGVTTTYKLSFSIATPATLGSISALFCSNDPIVTDPCTVPAGLDLSGASLTGQSGETGFTISPNSTANQLILSRPPAMSVSQPVSFTLSGVKNPSSEGSYYVRLQTFSSSDASGAETDHGGIAFAINSNVDISSYVPPYLLFCGGVTISAYNCSTAAGDYVNFGSLSTQAASAGQTQLVAATNASSGYVISYGGTTLTSGNNTIPALTAADVSRPGVSQFGINLSANQDPAVGQVVEGPGAGTVSAAYAVPNMYRFSPNDVLASAPGASDLNEYTISYLVNISGSQPAGVYVSTLTYVASARF